MTEIVAGRRNLTADTALRLARAFGTSAELWVNLEQSYELRTAELELGSSLQGIKRLRGASPLR